MSKLARERNLGPRSAAMLASVGLRTRADLERVGSIGAYELLCLNGQNPSFVLVYAIEGALQNRDWRDFSSEEREEMRREIE